MGDMNTKFKDFPRGYTEDQLLYLIWSELSGGESGEKGMLNSGRRRFPDGLDRADILYLIWKQLTSGERQFSSRYEASSITEIDPKVLDGLKCGDQVAKITGDQKHTYIVTYKGDGVGEGICLSYFAAGYLETVSYDYTSDGWVYNSTDVVEVGSGGGGGSQVQSDWAQSDNTQVDYIKNKPTILAPMVVSGTLEQDLEAEGTEFYFTENDGQPSWAEAEAHMLAGGIVYTNTNGSLCLMSAAESGMYLSGSPGGGVMIFWNNPSPVIPE